MMEMQMNSSTERSRSVPKLRFPEFSDQWEKKKLGDLTKWYSGGTPPKDNPLYWNGDIPWISASSMRGLEYGDSELKITSEGLINGSKLAKKGTLLILVRGSMLFNKIPIGITLKDVAFNQDVKSIEVDNNLTSSYILYWFIAKEPTIMSMVTGTGIGAGKLDLQDLKALKINLPSIPEQDKIALFLRSIDEKLQSLKKRKSLLEAYKKGVMQKLFSVKTDGRPSLRLKDENGKNFPEWVSKKIGNCLDYEQPTNYLVTSTEYEDKHSTPVVTAGKTFILGYTDEQFGIYDKGLPVIIFDDFTTASQFVDFPFKAKSSAMKILTAKENTDIKFMYEALQMINYETGAHGRHWISVFAEMEILIPSYKEQTRIANFLSALDEKIRAVQVQIEKTDDWKKGLLQKMFC